MHLGKQRRCKVGINVDVAELAHLHNTASPLDVLDKLFHHSKLLPQSRNHDAHDGVDIHRVCLSDADHTNHAALVYGAETHQCSCVRCS